MNIKNLKKDELLKIREDIDSQIKYIDQLKKEVKKPKPKNKLCDLNNGDKIFCIIFNGSNIWNIDYVKIDFYKQDDEKYVGLTNFSTSHESKPMGLSTCIKDECMNNHFYLVVSCSSNHFFTLKPKSWKKDLESEMTRIIKLKEINFKNEIDNFKNNINDLIKNSEVDDIINC